MSAERPPMMERFLEAYVPIVGGENAPLVSLAEPDEKTGEASSGAGGDSAAWDGRFELALSVFIRQYLASAPPPVRATLARDAAESAHYLERHGRDRLREAGARHLRAVD